MNLLSIAWRSLCSRPVVTGLTVAGVVLGAALITAVLTLRRETERAFLQDVVVADLVVGAKGSPLQLVLSSLYHLDVPTGNIAWVEYARLTRDPRVRRAIPLGLGDNHRGHRIVGTTPEFFNLERRHTDDTTRETAWEKIFRVGEGRLFEGNFEAVLGAQTARQTGLRLGDQFSGTHGLVPLAGSEEHDAHPYTVVGILAPSGTAHDRAIFASLESIWIVHDEEQALHEELFGKSGEEAAPPARFSGLFPGTRPPEPDPADDPNAAREVTAVIVQLHTPGMRLFLADEIQRTRNAMAAIPINEMLRLSRQVLGPVQGALLAVAWLVVVVAGMSILATLYQAGERRRRDVALMRAMGARRWEIFTLVLAEGVLVSLLGVVGGWLLGQAGVALAAGYLRTEMGLAVRGLSVDNAEVAALTAVVAAGIGASVIPALLAYRRSPVKDL
jgi:putative ABC transport system permease protein